MYYFFFNDTATTEIYTLSLHDALPICLVLVEVDALGAGDERGDLVVHEVPGVGVEHRVAHEDVDALVPGERAEVAQRRVGGGEQPGLPELAVGDVPHEPHAHPVQRRAAAGGGG